MGSSIIVRSKIKELVKEFAKSSKELAKSNNQPLDVSEDFSAKLCTKVEETIKDACRRAKANGRNTVMAKDL